jgi:hypothetical protein
MDFVELTSDYLLNHGLDLVSFSTTSQATNEDFFRSIYGIRCNAAKDIFDKLQRYEGDKKIIDIDLFYFFVALYLDA